MSIEIVVSVVFLVVLAITVWRYVFTPGRRVVRTLRKAARTDIRGAREKTVVTIEGKLGYEGEPLVAPLTGRTCAAYEVIVEERHSSGRRAYWKRVIHELRAQDFLVADGTGRALVRAAKPHVAIVQDAHFESGAFRDITPKLEDYLNRHGKRSRGWFSKKTLRYKEGVLAEGEQVAVCGQTRREIDPDPKAEFAGYREAPTRLVIEASGSTVLLVSDDPKALGEKK